jgi:hypothetical protein
MRPCVSLVLRLGPSEHANFNLYESTGNKCLSHCSSHSVTRTARGPLKERQSTDLTYVNFRNYLCLIPVSIPPLGKNPCPSLSHTAVRVSAARVRDLELGTCFKGEPQY